MRSGKHPHLNGAVTAIQKMLIAYGKYKHWQVGNRQAVHLPGDAEHTSVIGANVKGSYRSQWA